MRHKRRFTHFLFPIEQDVLHVGIDTFGIGRSGMEGLIQFAFGRAQGTAHHHDGDHGADRLPFCP